MKCTVMQHFICVFTVCKVPVYVIPVYKGLSPGIKIKKEDEILAYPMSSEYFYVLHFS